MATIMETNRIINSSVSNLDKNKDYTMTKDGWKETKTVDPGKEKWYTIAEAAKELSVPRNKIANAVYLGSLLSTEIPDSSRAGHHHLIRESDLIDWLDDPTKVRNQKKRDKYNEQYRTRTKNNPKTGNVLETGVPIDENGDAYLSYEEIAKEVGIGLNGVRLAVNKGALKVTHRNVDGHHRSYASKADIAAWRKSVDESLKKRSENITAINKARKGTSTKKVEESKKVEEPKKVDGITMWASSDEEVPNSLKDIIAQLRGVLDEYYKKGFEDGKLSVEHDISDEYSRGYEEGKKAAKEELMAVLKGV